jgi:hypothetical protein
VVDSDHAGGSDMNTLQILAAGAIAPALIYAGALKRQ